MMRRLSGGVVEVGLDGVGAGGVVEVAPAAGFLVPEAEHGAENVSCAAPTAKRAVSMRSSGVSTATTLLVVPKSMPISLVMKAPLESGGRFWCK